MKSAIAAVLLVISCASLHAQYTGQITHVGCDNISGWAWNSGSPNSPWPVDIYSDGTLVTTVQADQASPTFAFGPD